MSDYPFRSSLAAAYAIMADAAEELRRETPRWKFIERAVLRSLAREYRRRQCSRAELDAAFAIARRIEEKELAGDA